MTVPDTSGGFRRGPLRTAGVALVAACALALAGGGAPAGATVAPAAVLDGAGVVDVGTAALAADGTGGLVYRRLVDGVPHVFVVRFDRGTWSAPMRVDGAEPFAATLPRLAAGPNGRLVAVWVQAAVTQADGNVRSRLMSALLAPKATSFGAPLVVDRDVQDGMGVDPSVTMTATGRAHVVYRVITSSARTSFRPYQPGDVLTEVRAAYLNGPTWSSIGVLSRNRTIPQRAPTIDNAPRLGESPMGGAVVVWQETDQRTGVAGVYGRRLFGAVAGPILPVSPTVLDGAPVVTDVDALDLAVSPLRQADVAMRLKGGASGGARLLLNELPVSIDAQAAKFAGAVAAPGQGPAGRLGAPVIAVADGGKNGHVQVAYTADDEPRVMTSFNGTTSVRPLGGFGAGAGRLVATLDPSGGGVVAWPTVDASGGPAVAIRQDFADGAFQTAVVGGSVSGPVAGLSLGGSGYGDAIVGFGQGSPGGVQVVAATVKAPPAKFDVVTPTGWVTPAKALVSWEPPQSAFGGLRYALAVDGIVRRRELRGLSTRLVRSGLGDGKHEVQVIATDGVGQQTATGRATVSVDGVAPTAAARHVRRKRRSVQVVVTDAGVGVDRSATRVSFGDGRSVHGSTRITHAYKRPGRFTIVAVVEDKMRHRATRRLHVTIR